MNDLDLTSADFIIVLMWILTIMVSYPFVKAYLLYLATRILKFKNLSYWKSLFCILIGIGVLMMIQMIFMGIAFQSQQEIDPQAIKESNAITIFFSFLFIPLAEGISIFLFFKESFWKTLGGLLLANVFMIVLFIIFFILLIVTMMIFQGIAA